MKKQRRFVISDIHGGYKALKQVLKKANVDYDNDKLIVTGDCCDCWPEVKECFDEIMKFKNLIYILGNHDNWAKEYYNTGEEPRGWYSEGGKATIDAFANIMPLSILRLINEAPAYYIEDNMLFLHAGFDPDIEIEKQDELHLIWDRNLMNIARHKMKMSKIHGHNAKISKYDKIFIGHTPTLSFDNSTTPINYCEVHLIDTGASYYGPLTLMDIDTEEYWQSDPVNSFYPGIKARGHWKGGPLPEINFID